MPHKQDDDNGHTTAKLLYFPRGRGRPRLNRAAHDTGTPELVMKRALGQTSEALDLCFNRGIITREQHWCGIHLRWLYTLRHGAPGVRAIDPTHLGGMELKLDDPEWRTAREQEYSDAMNLLAKRGYAIQLMNICVYNERPKFLAPGGRITAKRAHEIGTDIGRIRDGLDVLTELWERGRKK